MKKYEKKFYKQICKSFHQLLDKMIKRKDDDDKPFDHPWVIY